MACCSTSVPCSPTAQVKKDVFKEHMGLHSRPDSVKDVHKQVSLRRSYSDNHLCHSINRIRATSLQPKLKSSPSFGIFPFQISSSIIPNSLRSFLFEPETSKDTNMMEKDTDIVESSEESNEEDVKRANWVERLLELRSHWRNNEQTNDIDGDEPYNGNESADCDCDGYDGGCMVDYNFEEEVEEGGEMKFNRETFSRFLAQVPWSDTKLFSKLAFLCNMAYVIPEIKAKDLRKHYGLQFVTSSLQKKADAEVMNAKLDLDSTRVPAMPPAVNEFNPEKTRDPEHKRTIRSSVAYEIAASAASYVQSRAKCPLSGSSESWQENDCVNTCRSGDQLNEEEESLSRVHKSEVAAYVTASTMTAVVAAGEKKKQEAANDLQSLHSSPCEWFVCDDLSTYTRCFVIQGSDSLASWQANLLFEPTKFEGTEVLVHRGIYEAAKGIYEQFLPEIIEHLNKYGERAKLQFTGHSLGGSLSLLINLMLLTRKIVEPSILRPVVTFGSPFVFCGGQKILNDLGLDDSDVHCVMMHRDIVPRAFSCNYPNHVAVVLKRLNSSFRSHPCLTKNKVLYSPLGKLFILQPDEKSSPPHPLLPPGSALYALDKTRCGFSASVIRAFLNSPHPLDTLSDPAAYGSEGTILRDHDSSNYLKVVNGVLRQNTKPAVRKVKYQTNPLWPLLISPSPHSWNPENNSDHNVLVKKELITSV